MPNYFADKYGYAPEEGDVQNPAASINNEQGQETGTALPDSGPLPGNYFAEKYGYDEEAPPEIAAPKEGTSPTWQDYGRMVMGGGASIGSGVGWLLERMGAEEIGGAVRKRSEQSRKAWMEDSLDVIGLEEKGLSEQARKALSTEFLGEGSYGDKWDRAKLTAASSLLGTMAGMGLGGVLTKGLAAAGLGGRAAAAVGYGAGEAGVAAPSTGAATEDEVNGMDHETLMGSLEYQAAYEAMSNLEEDERRAKAKKLVAEAAGGQAAAQNLLSTFILSAPFSQTLAKLAARVPAPGGRIAGAVTGAAEETTQEFLQSGAEQFATNLAIKEKADPTRNLGKDVLEQAVGGGLSGTIMGGTVGLAGGGAAAPEEPGPMADLEAQQNAARDNVAAAGGDNLDQELAAAQAGIAPGAAIDEETANRNRMKRMQELVDQEAAYAETQVKEDEARAKIQAEAAQRYEQGLQQIKQDTEAAQNKAQFAETVGTKQANIEKADILAAEKQAEAEKAAVAKTRAAEKADAKMRKLKKRRQELGLAPKEELPGQSPYPSSAEVTTFKGKKPPNRAMAEAMRAAVEKGGKPGGPPTPPPAGSPVLKSAYEAATSPTNAMAEPSPAQIEAGNYKKGHVKLQGLDISIENPAGSTRVGESREGVAWSQKMRDHYGYIKGTESAEGPNEQLDAFINKNPTGDKVFVIDQIDQTTGEFDEHKVMLGYPNQLSAVRAYKRNFEKGWKVGPVTEMQGADFKEWIDKGDTTRPLKPIAGTTPASAEQLKEVIQAKTRRGGRRPRILYRKGEEGSSERLSTEIKERGGFTVDNETGQPRTDGYAVGIGAEEIVPGDATPAQIDAYRKKHAEELARPDHYLGAWKYKGNTYLDISRVFTNTPMGRENALALGAKNKEIGIMDLSKSPEEGYIPIKEKKPEGQRTSKITSADIKKINKILNDPNAPKGGWRGYRKEVALRADMEDKGPDTYNYALYENSDLADLHPLKNLAGKEIEQDKRGVIELDVWMYRQGELESQEPVYITDMGTLGKSITLTAPDQADILRAAVAAASANVEEIEAAPAPEAPGEQFKAVEMNVADLENVPGDAQRKSPEEMAEFTKKIKSGEIQPLVIVETVNGKPTRIVEGNHTLRALRALGQKKVIVRTRDVGTGTGRDFKDFFASVTRGVTGTSSTGAEYVPVIPAAANALRIANSPIAKFSAEYAKHRGNFDDHIAFSIPGYKEVQQLVGQALVANYGTGDSLLDIGASEGSFVKAVSALSGMSTVALDPNPEMAATFNEVSQVPGSEYSMTALGSSEEEGQLAWREDDGQEIKYYDPKGKKFDVVHEAMVFQFISNDRKEQIARVKELLKADGVAIVEEKMFTDNQAANEKKKNEYKSKFFEKKDLDAKSAEVLEGMHVNMVHQNELESILSDNFNYVTQFWDSGNFKGYMASDSKEALDKMVASVGDTDSEFAAEPTPRDLNEENMRYRRAHPQPERMTRAEAEEALEPMIVKLPLLQPTILGTPMEAPEDIRQQMEDDGAMGAKGVYDVVSDKLYIFSENHMNADDLQATVMHEGIAHKGLRYLLGDRTTDILRSVFEDGNSAGIARIARKYSLDMENTADQLIAAEEYIASVAETGVDSGLFERVVAAIRQALRDLGLVKKWTDSDIRALLRDARSGLRGKPLSKVSITTEVEIEETGEVVKLETPGDVALRQMDKRMSMVERLRACIG